METLGIKNFLTLKDINLEINRINILIGPQAEGKSLIAKLVYFFKTVPRKFTFSVAYPSPKREMDKWILSDFNDIFPLYSLSGTKFELKYTYGNVNTEIKIYSKILKSKKTKLYIEYSEDLIKAFRRIKIKYKQRLKTNLNQATIDEKTQRKLDREVIDLFHGPLSIGQRSDLITFIPAGRSFFLNIERNIWSFIESGANLEYFIKSFGSTYEQMKEYYKETAKIKNGDVSQLYKIIKKLMKGTYYLGKKEDYIYSTKLKRSTYVKNTSSGQQEIVPMVVVLCALGAVRAKTWAQSFFIEEPEAHLFPDSQKLIVDLLGLLYNIDNRRLGLFLTTHSPYILTAFNNIIQADNTLLKIKSQPEVSKLKKKLIEVVPENLMISFDHVSSYYLFDGKVIDLLDRENRIIDSNRIDEISNELENTFNKLLDIYFEEK